MATAKTPKKAAARKRTTKTAAPKAAARKRTTKTPAPKAAAETVRENVAELADEMTEKAEDAFETAVRVVRDAAHTYIGAGFVIQDRLVARNFEMVDYRTFLDDAKAKGAERVAEFQSYVEPYVERVNKLVEPMTEKFEAQLPEQVREMLVDSRAKVRELLAV